MKKILYFIFLVIICSNNCKIYADNKLNQSAISIKNLILLKNYSNEQIHDYLILNSWIFVSNETTRKGGSIIPFEEQVILYKHNFNDINISIVKKVFFKDGKREVISKTDKYIEVTTESPNEYKIILNDLYGNSYKIDGKENQPFLIEIATTGAEDLVIKMKRDYLNTKTSYIDYTNGNDKVTLYTRVFEKYDNNMRKLSRNRYTLIVDCNKVINRTESSNKSNISSLKIDKQLNNCLSYNQELIKQNEKLKSEIQELISISKNSIILSTEGAANIEKALESVKEKDLKISELQDALTRKDSITLELIKELKKNNK